MSSDGGVEIPFAAIFPLPFRALFLAGMGILGWATNLHGLNLLGIDAASVLDLRKTSQEYSPVRVSLPSHRGPGFKLVPNPAAIYEPIYRLSAAFVMWCFVAWAVFRLSTHGDVILVDVFRFVPAICALGVLIVLACPFNVCYKRERDSFLLSIWRCLFSPLDCPVYFSDVIFADIFTSFAKVLGDVWLSISMLLPGASLLSLPRQDGMSSWILPTIMSLPYLVRLRQCIIEHLSPMNESRRPLYNALKYASSFPVIFLSAAQRTTVADLRATESNAAASKAWHGDALFRLWLLAAAINSLYSFWWDVTNDWGLDLLRPRFLDGPQRALSPPRPLVLPALHSTSPSSRSTSLNVTLPPNANNNTHPLGLRSTLLYPLPVYPLIVFLNLVLRLTWSIKLSSHLHSRSSEGSVIIFWLEMAELVRRWMWVFLRVEWEVVRKIRDSGRSRRIGSRHESGDPEESYELLPPSDEDVYDYNERHNSNGRT